jgi:DNA-binding NtrC family response regulator
VGEVGDRQVDIRLIAATHQDLGHLVRERRFREDLYFRISTIPLAVPPLRDRVEDISLLARQLLDRLGVELGRAEVGLAPDAEKALREYRWPGNIRELRNVLERAVLLGERDVLTRQDLRFEAPMAAGSSGDDDANLTLLQLERAHIERVLREERGHVERAARRLGLPRSSLYQKIKRHGVHVPKA